MQFATSGCNNIIQGQRINLLCVADDIARPIVAKNAQSLNESLDKVEEIISKECNLRINKWKTKVIACSKKEVGNLFRMNG